MRLRAISHDNSHSNNIYDFQSCTDSSVVRDPISDAGGPRFESHAGRVTGKPTPSLWRDKHPAIKGLRPPEHHAGKFRQDQKTPPSQTKNACVPEARAIRALRSHARPRHRQYGQTADEDPRKSEFESKRILNVEGGLS